MDELKNRRIEKCLAELLATKLEKGRAAVFKKHKTLLLDPMVDTFLEANLEKPFEPKNRKQWAVLKEHQEFLKSHRKPDKKPIFDQVFSIKCWQIITQLDQALNSSDPYHQIDLCQMGVDEIGDTQFRPTVARLKWIQVDNLLKIPPSEKFKDPMRQGIKLMNFILYTYEYENFPERWKAIQLTLGTTHLRRRSGDLDENIEKSIFHFENVLPTLTEVDDVPHVPIVAHHLTSLFQRRNYGDKTYNLEKSKNYAVLEDKCKSI